MIDVFVELENLIASHLFKGLITKTVLATLSITFVQSGIIDSTLAFHYCGHGTINNITTFMRWSLGS